MCTIGRSRFFSCRVDELLEDYPNTQDVLGRAAVLPGDQIAGDDLLSKFPFEGEVAAESWEDVRQTTQIERVFPFSTAPNEDQTGPELREGALFIPSNRF